MVPDSFFYVPEKSMTSGRSSFGEPQASSSLSASGYVKYARATLRMAPRTAVMSCRSPTTISAPSPATCSERSSARKTKARTGCFLASSCQTARLPVAPCLPPAPAIRNFATVSCAMSVSVKWLWNASCSRAHGEAALDVLGRLHLVDELHFRFPMSIVGRWPSATFLLCARAMKVKSGRRTISLTMCS
jgi:hypothetical protein